MYAVTIGKQSDFRGYRGDSQVRVPAATDLDRNQSLNL